MSIIVSTLAISEAVSECDAVITSPVARDQMQILLSL